MRVRSLNGSAYVALAVAAVATWGCSDSAGMGNGGQCAACTPIPDAGSADGSNVADAGDRGCARDAGPIEGFGVKGLRARVLGIEMGGYQTAFDGERVVLAGDVRRQASEGVAIVSVSPEGCNEWSKWFETSREGVFSIASYFRGPVVDSFGSAYVGGGFSGTFSAGGHVVTSTLNPGSPDQQSGRGLPSTDMFVLKLDRRGEIEWLKSFGGVASQAVQHLVAAPDASLVMVGIFEGRLMLDELELVSSGGSTRTDLVVARLDANGNAIAARQHPCHACNVTSAALDSEGNLVLGIWVSGPGSGGLGVGDSGVVKLDPSGSVIWVSSFDPLAGPTPTSIAIDSNDSVIVGAGGYVSESIYGEVIGERGIVLVKLDRNGAPLFTKLFGKSDLDFAGGVVVGADDSIVVTGAFYRTADFGGGELRSADPEKGDFDVFVAGLEPDGEHRFSFRAGGPGLDLGQHIAILSDGALLTSGYVESALDFGSGAVPFDGGGRYVARIGP